MTLILGALAKDIAVVAADGAEFTHTTGEQKVLAAQDRRKLLPVGQHIVLAVHGQNRLAPVGQDLSQQRLVIDLLDELKPQLLKIATVKGMAEELLKLLHPAVSNTFPLLRQSKIHDSALGVLAIGFDRRGGRSQAYEAFWPLLGVGNEPHIVEIVKANKKVWVVHSGTGAKYAEQVVGEPEQRRRLDSLHHAHADKVQQYVRGVYERANAKQPQPPEFCGHYHEVTITTRGLSWTVPAKPNPASGQEPGSSASGAATAST